MAGIETLTLSVDGLGDLIEDTEKLTHEHRKVIAESLNSTLYAARKLLARRMESEVSFPSGYLIAGKRGGKLEVRKEATPSDLTATVFAAARKTSLARFSNRNPLASRAAGGVTVRVKPGASRFMKGAFLVKGKAGTRLDEDHNNMLLAIRTKSGKVSNKKLPGMPAYPGPDENKPRAWRGVFLLYGPSVYQVARNVIPQLEGEIQQILIREYLSRQGQLNE